MTYADQITAIWNKVHDLLYGPGRQIRGMMPTTSMALPDKFDQDLLNLVAKLKTVPVADRQAAIAHVRGQLQIATAVNLIGANDEAAIQTLLDELETK